MQFSRVFASYCTGGGNLPHHIEFNVRNKLQMIKLRVLPPTGLFEKHKLMFSFQMALKILEGERELNHEHLDFFLKGNLSLEKSNRKKPFTWLPDQGWEDIIRLVEVAQSQPRGSDSGTEGVSPLVNLADDIECNESVWKDFYELEVRKTHQHCQKISLNGALQMVFDFNPITS